MTKCREKIDVNGQLFKKRTSPDGSRKILSEKLKFFIKLTKVRLICDSKQVLKI